MQINYLSIYQGGNVSAIERIEKKAASAIATIDAMPEGGHGCQFERHTAERNAVMPANFDRYTRHHHGAHMGAE